MKKDILPHSLYTQEELQRTGLTSRDLQLLHDDPYLGKVMEKHGFLGACVLNVLLRNHVRSFSDPLYVNAYQFSEVMGVPFDQVLDKEIPTSGKGMLSLVERVKTEGRDDFVLDVRNVHHYFALPFEPNELTREVMRYQDTGDKEIVNALVRRHMPLVYTAINRYKRYQRFDLFDDDFFLSAGLFAFVESLRLYDRRLQVQFSTYFFAAVKGRIQHDMNKQMGGGDDIKKMTIALDRITHSHQVREGRKPTIEELVSESGFTKEHIESFFQLAHAKRLSRLDREFWSEGESTLKDFLPDYREVQPWEASHFQELRQNVLRAVRGTGADARGERAHRRVRIYDLYCFLDYSLEEVGKVFNLSRERIRQILNDHKVHKRIHYALGLEGKMNEEGNGQHPRHNL